MNPFLPVLHRPSFERALNDRRHLTDIGFGSVVMLVCAIGALWTDDGRVYIEGMSKHSSGWKWFEQVQVQRKSFLGPPRLYDLQIYAVCFVPILQLYIILSPIFFSCLRYSYTAHHPPSRVGLPLVSVSV